MKRLTKIIIMAAFASSQVCCTQMPSLVEGEPNDLQLLQQLGYPTQNVIEQEELYLIPPDVIVSKATLENLRLSPQTRMQMNQSYQLLDEQYHTIYLKNNNIARFEDLLLQAVAEWNKLEESSIRFVFDNNADLAVDISGGNNGDMFDPVSIEKPAYRGQYSQYVRLNYDKVLPLLSDPEQGKYLMMHILGHLVGFAHAVTDPFAGSIEGVIPGTDFTDSESIMRTPDDILYNKKKWTGFSKSDIRAIETVYPRKSPVYDLVRVPAGDDRLDVRTKYRFEATCDRPSAKFDIKIERKEAPGKVTIEPVDNGIFNATFHMPGVYRIIVNVKNIAKPFEFVRNYTVYSPDPIITPPAKIILGETCTFQVDFFDRSENPGYKVTVTPPVTASDYKIVKKSNAFDIRFNQPGVYRLTVTNATNNTAINATCDVNIHYTPYWSVDSFNQPGKEKFWFSLSFFSDEACTKPEIIRHGVSFDYNLCYRSERQANGSYTMLSKPVCIEKKTMYAPRQTEIISLPNRNRDTTVRKGISKFRRYSMPFYTISYPENTCTISNQ